jgi:hypothetical protein
MAKATSKEIVSRIKKKQVEEEKGNVTFRLNKALMTKFRGKCEQNDLAMAAVLEELIADFVGL